MSWSRGGFEYGEEINDYETDRDQALLHFGALLVGKEITDVSIEDVGTDELIILRLKDGSAVTLVSWDYEGYSSGIYIFKGEPPKEAA